MSQRAPIMFTRSPTELTFSHPYLIALAQDSIQIYSNLDDQLKQEIPLRQCRTLTNMLQDTTQMIIVTTRDSICLLEPLSLEEQIDQLLNAYRLQEALTLAESSCPSVKQRSTNPVVIATKKRIAFVEFGAMNVVRALGLFEEARVDFHEVTSTASTLDHRQHGGSFRS